MQPTNGLDTCLHDDCMDFHAIYPPSQHAKLSSSFCVLILGLDNLFFKSFTLHNVVRL